MKIQEWLHRNLRITLEQWGELLQLGLKKGFTKDVLKLISENVKYEELVRKAIKAGDGSDEQRELMAEMEAINERQFCEATAGLEKVREEKQRIDAKLEKALEEKRKAAVRLKEALEEKRKGK